MVSFMSTDAAHRPCADDVEAATMRHRVGETFRGLVVDVTQEGAWCRSAIR
jgi:exoribonuclease R